MSLIGHMRLNINNSMRMKNESQIKLEKFGLCCVAHHTITILCVRKIHTKCKMYFSSINYDVQVSYN